MNVQDLIQKLSAYEPDTLVLIAVDEEGNGFHELEDVEFSAVEDEGYEFNVLHPDDEDEDEEYTRAVVLWP